MSFLSRGFASMMSYVWENKETERNASISVRSQQKDDHKRLHQDPITKWSEFTSFLTNRDVTANDKRSLLQELFDAATHAYPGIPSDFYYEGLDMKPVEFYQQEVPKMMHSTRKRCIQEGTHALKQFLPESIGLPLDIVQIIWCYDAPTSKCDECKERFFHKWDWNVDMPRAVVYGCTGPTGFAGIAEWTINTGAVGDVGQTGPVGYGGLTGPVV
jgi:hypothetical protein